MDALKNILGKRILGIYVDINQELGGLDEAQAYIELEDGKLYDFPLHIDCWFECSPTDKVGLENVNDILFEEQECLITDIIEIQDFFQDIFIEIDNKSLFKLQYVAPNGSMRAGIISYPEIEAFELREGTNYKRLRQQ